MVKELSEQDKQIIAETYEAAEKAFGIKFDGNKRPISWWKMTRKRT